MLRFSSMKNNTTPISRVLDKVDINFRRRSVRRNNVIYVGLFVLGEGHAGTGKNLEKKRRLDGTKSVAKSGDVARASRDPDGLLQRRITADETANSDVLVVDVLG